MVQYVGLDGSLNEVAICVVDDEGGIECEGTTLSEPEAIAEWSLDRDVPPDEEGPEICGLAPCSSIRFPYDRSKALTGCVDSAVSVAIV